MNPQQIEETLTDKVKSIERDMKAGMDKLLPKLGEFAKEMQIISIPKSKKDIVVDGKNVYASLLTDGRVIVHFSALDDAQKYFDTL